MNIFNWLGMAAFISVILYDDFGAWLASITTSVHPYVVCFISILMLYSYISLVLVNLPYFKNMKP